MKNSGENSDSIPNDLILEILSRLPGKSIKRFRSVSKQWGSMLSSPYFTELFRTRSLARSRLLFAVEGDGECLFFSAAQPQNPYGKSSLVVALDSHMKLPGDISRYSFSYAAGLIYLHNIRKPTEDDDDAMRLICNPITGQYAILPELETDLEYSFLGFDPIDKQFKVLVVDNAYYGHYIMTLGSDKVKWRKIRCPLIHCLGESICINGVLYYSAQQFDKMSGSWCDDGIVSFDVRSEKFKFLDPQCLSGLYGVKLLNFKGKLCWIKMKDSPSKIFRDDDPIKLCMWVLEDVEKQEWSKYDYTLPENEVVGSSNLDIVGVTCTGEIVFSNFHLTKPFYVFYFNPERNTLQRVEIQCNHEMVEEGSKFYAIVDHVEDLDFNIMETTYAAASLSPPEQSTSTSTRNDDHRVKISDHPQQDGRSTFESMNKFDYLYLLDDDEFTGVNT